MVRRWSYINSELRANSPALAHLAGEHYDPLSIKHSFKNFRKTTKFKKYTLGLTKSVRKTFLNRKFKSSHYSLTTFGSKWVKAYLNLRRSYKDYQLINLSSLSLKSLSPSKKLNLLDLGVPSTYYSVSGGTRVICGMAPGQINVINKLMLYYALSDGSSQFYLNNFDWTTNSSKLSVLQSTTLIKHVLSITINLRRLLTLLILKNL